MCFKLFETLILFGFLHGIHAIVGGKEADLPIPWQVAIHHVHYGQFCGGTILDSKTILSAAHCFQDDIPADLLYITAGDVHVDFYNPWLGYSVEEVIVHPDFGNGFYDNDIALLKLSNEISFKDGIVQPVSLPNGDYDPPVGSACFVSGWGRDNSKEESDILKWTQVSIVDSSEFHGAKTQDLDSMIYTLSPTRTGSTCFGDSGGPLVCLDGQVPVITGVINAAASSFFAGENCEPFLPGSYARVTWHLDWIKKFGNFSLDESMVDRLPDRMNRNITKPDGMSLIKPKHYCDKLDILDTFDVLKMLDMNLDSTPQTYLIGYLNLADNIGYLDFFLTKLRLWRKHMEVDVQTRLRASNVH